MPAVQNAPAGQGLPHMPQFDVSFWRLVQMQPQRVVPAAQPSGHDPLKHAVPAQQVCPQPPQLLRSVLVSTHTKPPSEGHIVSPVVQRGASRATSKGASVTGTSVTGTSVTGTSATGTSVTGTSVTGTSVTGTSVTGVSIEGVSRTTSFAATSAAASAVVPVVVSLHAVTIAHAKKPHRGEEEEKRVPAVRMIFGTAIGLVPATLAAHVLVMGRALRSLLSLVALVALPHTASALDTHGNPRPRPARPRPAQPSPTPQGVCGLRAGDVFTGSYYCAQGDTALTLRVLSVEGASLRVEFVFNHAPSHAAGRYTLTGMCASGHVTLQPEAWISRPPGYIMVGMEGDAARDGRFSGRMTHTLCGAFSVTAAR